MPRGRWRMQVMAGLVTMASPARPAHAERAPSAILEVPYLAQSELLCGGAAVAMVERWWGRRRVYGEDFASLVRPAEGGIRTTDLVVATRARGWHATVVHGTADAVRRALADSIPVIALVTTGGNRRHYVVIVGWTEDEVVYHDPAIAPDLRTTPARFLSRWQPTGGWAMLVTPPSATVSEPSPLPPGAPPLPCQPWTGQAARSAGRGDLAEADRLLDQADATCPTLAILRRERAGIRFRQRRYDAAAALATEYLESAPDDSLAWQLLASARYLGGDRLAALAAWNRIGRPTVDLVTIGGVHHIRYPRLLGAIGTHHGSVLTSREVAMARRRLSDVPALAASRVDLRAVPDGLVEVEAHVVERSPFPDPRQLLLRTAASSVARAEIGVQVHSPSGNGESWSFRWRWEDVDRVGEIGLDVPVRVGMPAIVRVSGRRERDRFDDGTVVRRTSTTVAGRVWVTPTLEGMVATRLDDWRVGRRSLAVGVGAGLHPWHDRLALLGWAEHAVGLADQASFNRFTALGSWLSGGVVALSLRGGVDWASAPTPRSLLPLAGGAIDRAIPLRAHRFATDHGLPAGRQGTTVFHGGVAADHRFATLGLVSLGAGAFVDAAHRVRAGIPSDAWLDAGVGITIGIAGMSERLRVDVARGLSDQTGWIVTAGLTRPWPPRLGDLQ